VSSGWADVAVAGWAFGHMRYEHPDQWRDSVTSALSEMERALRPQGVTILIETLGTGVEKPKTSPELAEYLGWLEHVLGMTRMEIRTDYLFPDADAAARATSFFFGRAFADAVRRRGNRRIPECTGLWWRRRG
jgi:hypothetical protein